MPATRTTKNVSLTPELDRFVDALVASGRYNSASEVVRAGLRLLHAAEVSTAPHLSPLATSSHHPGSRRSPHAQR